jgi:hypothetical protein
MAAPTNAAYVKKALANSEPSTHVQVFGRRDGMPSTRSGDRRPKSARAGNRGKWRTGGAADAMGI